MSMKRFRLEKLLGKAKEMNVEENVKHIVEIIKAAGLDESVEVVRQSFTITAEFTKSSPKFADEPKIEPGSGVFPMWVTTRDVDRDNEVVMPRGLSLKEWMKSGVIIQGHDYSTLPLGKAVWVGVSDYGVKMHIEAAPTEKGKEILALSKFMPLTASIGFGVEEYARKGSPEFEKIMRKSMKDWPEMTQQKADRVSGIVLKSTLFEVSIVSVPANPNAVQTQIAKSALSGDVLTESDKQIVRKVFAIDDDDQGDDQAKRIGQLEGEVRDLKAKCTQMIEENADLTRRLKAVCDSHRIDRVSEIEVIDKAASYEVEVVGKSIDVVDCVKRVIDLRRGLI